MTIIEQIKAEIERRIEHYKEWVEFYKSRGTKSDYDETILGAYSDLLSFLSTLESENPMNQEGLEEEIQRFLSNATKMDKGEWKGKYPISEMGFGVVARHFFNLGLNARKEENK